MAVRFYDEQSAEWRTVEPRPRGAPSTLDVLRRAGRVPLMEQMARMDPYARYPALRQLRQYEAQMRWLKNVDRAAGHFGR